MEQVKNFLLQSDTWTGDSVRKVEDKLKERNLRFQSYPLNGGIWEIRYRGPYLGPFLGFTIRVLK